VNPAGKTLYINHEERQQYIIFYEYERGVKYRNYKLGRGIEVLDMTYEDFYTLLEDECHAMLDAKKDKSEDIDENDETVAVDKEPCTELKAEETAQTTANAEVRKSELMEQIHDTVERIRRMDEGMKYRLMRIEAKTLLDRLVMLDEVMNE
jgi:predicted  nucleic acid-binding Zn-ribbon protein